MEGGLRFAWKMLNGKDWYGDKLGWDEYLRRYYDYSYTFEMMLEEIRVLSKLENKDIKEFKSRSRFFNKEVVVATCKDYIKKLNSHYESLPILNKRKEKRLKGIGRTDKDKFETILNKLNICIINIYESENYNELYVNLRMFIKNMVKLPRETAKCKEWKEAFKGAGAYYSLKNMIMFHGVVLRDCNGKDDSLEALEEETYMHFKNEEIWKLHYLMKDVIEYNNFDLARSIERNKRK